MRPESVIPEAHVTFFVSRMVQARHRVLVARLVGVTVAVAFVAIMRLGQRQEMHTALIDMGFDPGRAFLLTALLLGATASAIVALITGQGVLSVALGWVVVLVDDAGAFRDETLGALRASGSDGAFDPVGWLLTGVAILVAGLVVSGAATILAVTVRAWLSRSIRLTADVIRGHGDERRKRSGMAWLPAITVVAIALLVVAAPVLADMLNYATDIRMRTGGPSHVALFGGAADVTGAVGASPQPTHADAGATPSGSPAALGPDGFPADLVAGPVHGSLVTRGALAAAAPWRADSPTGPSRTLQAVLPPAWLGPPQVTVDVYLPPGYGTQTGRRYPVMYTLPWGLASWDRGMKLTSTMDGLITGGELPPTILIFVPIEGGPYADPECSDSRDGTEWVDKWVARTLVPWVDATFRTIPTAAARTVMGSSKGGYCAASVLTHHPDLFANGISMSGYFVAGLASSETIGADLVFGQDPAYEQSQSPILRLTAIAPGVRHGMFMVLEADPQGHLFGRQMLDFARALDQAGIPEALFPSRLGHSWSANRAILPSALRLVAARQVDLGVFGQR